ncbi:MAG: DUF3352 domain-containing protein [Acidobacteriota bacterium]|nr:DUF3352 domain-containing protein [Acidobacteriota bacterium]
MKKSILIALVVFLAFTGPIACKKAVGPEAGPARAEALLNLLPRESQGVVVADIHRGMALDVVRKALIEDDAADKYAEFVAMTGIDPKEDIFALAFAVMGPLSADDMEGAAVIDMRFDRDKILSKLREEVAELRETSYEGIALYSWTEKEGDGKPAFGAILDENHIVIGSESGVKSVIDVSRKKAESLSKNAELTAVIKTVNKNALLWSAFLIPAEAMEDATEGNPMLASLEGIKSLSLHFDYQNKAMNAEIKAMGGTADQNRQLADMLGGFKAMIGMGASAEPGIPELLNAIEISSGADFIRIAAAIPDELMDKLSKSAQEKVGALTAPKDDDEYDF